MMRSEYILDFYVPTLSVGHASALDQTAKSRKKKHPLGFVANESRRKKSSPIKTSRTSK